jgi:hypothetical protein
MFAMACDELGDAAAARQLFGLLAKRASDWAIFGNGRYCNGPIAYHLGTLAITTGDLDEADELLEQALASADPMRSPPWRARALARAGALLRAAWQRGSTPALTRACATGRNARSEGRHEAAPARAQPG